MKTELFIRAGVASFGESWKSQTQRALGVNSGVTNIPHLTTGASHEINTGNEKQHYSKT